MTSGSTAYFEKTSESSRNSFRYDAQNPREGGKIDFPLDDKIESARGAPDVMRDVSLDDFAIVRNVEDRGDQSFDTTRLEFQALSGEFCLQIGKKRHLFEQRNPALQFEPELVIGRIEAFKAV